MGRRTKISQNQYQILLFSMKLTNLLRAKETRLEIFSKLSLLSKEQGKNHVTGGRHEESVTKLMTTMHGDRAEGTLACFLD